MHDRPWHVHTKRRNSEVNPITLHNGPMMLITISGFSMHDQVRNDHTNRRDCNSKVKQNNSMREHPNSSFLKDVCMFAFIVTEFLSALSVSALNQHSRFSVSVSGVIRGVRSAYVYQTQPVT